MNYSGNTYSFRNQVKQRQYLSELLERQSSSSMAIGRFQIRGTCRRLKPHFLMTLAQLGYTILYFITEASFNRGLNPNVYITYRHLVGGLVMWPFAYFLERYTIFISHNMQVILAN